METPNPIIVKHGTQLRIAESFGCSKTYVSLALKGKRTKDVAEKIRLTAINQFNGVEVPLTQDQKSKI